MSFYAILVFLHIVGALGLFAALAVEWAAIGLLRRAATVTQARDGIHLLGLIPRVEAPAALVVLATGLYLSFQHWGLRAWIVAGVVGFVANGVLGAVFTRRRIDRLASAMPVVAEPIEGAVQRLPYDPLLHRSAFLRTAIGLGLVFVMSTKPEMTGSIVVLAAAALLGAMPGAVAVASGRRAAGAGIGPTG